MKYNPPFKVVYMPLNERGEGPEEVIAEIDVVKFEIWDSANQKLSSHENRTQANYFCKAYNDDPDLANRYARTIPAGNILRDIINDE